MQDVLRVGELLDGHNKVSGRRLDNGPGPRGEDKSGERVGEHL